MGRRLLSAGTVISCAALAASAAVSADAPSPHEVTASGFVKIDAIYDRDQDLGDFFSYSSIGGHPSAEHFRLHARQSRLRFESRSETAVGEIRATVEGDFFSGGTFGSLALRARHLWGEWDIVPDWQFAAGQGWSNFISPSIAIATLDYSGPAGLIDRSRAAQVRLSRHSGAAEFAVALEDPPDSSDLFGLPPGGSHFGAGTDTGSRDALPVVTLRGHHAGQGGREFLIAGLVRRFRSEPRAGAAGSGSAFGWGIHGAASVPVADRLTLSGSVMYGRGLGTYLLGSNMAGWIDPADGAVATVAALGLYAGGSIELTGATSVNLGWGYATTNGGDLRSALAAALDAGAVSGELDRSVMSVHGNLLWQAARQLRLGCELVWGERTYHDLAAEGALRTGSNIRAQFATWFFF